MLIGLVISLTLLIPSIAQAVLFLIFVLLSFALSFMRVFKSVWRHISNWLLELNLVFLGGLTLYEEISGPADTVGMVYIIVFTVCQIVVFILIMVEVIISVRKLFKKCKKRSEKYRIKSEIEEYHFTNSSNNNEVPMFLHDKYGWMQPK